MRLALFSALLLALPAAAQDSNCDTELTSQAEVDAFDCTEIAELSIRSLSGDISDLAGLSELEVVRGRLEIQGNHLLVDLNGLANLSLVGDDLDLVNTRLVSLLGLGSLASVGGDLRISGNAGLSTLSGLEALASIGDDLRLIDLASLESLEGLSELADLAGDLFIAECYSLWSLRGLNSLATVGGSVSIFGSSLTSMEGLESVASVGGLNLQENSLRDLRGLESLQTINGSLRLRNNRLIENIEALGRLTSVGDALDIRGNSVLASLGGLELLEFIGSDLQVSSNDRLTNVDGLSNLAIVGGYMGIGMRVETNPLLERCATGLGPVLAADREDPGSIGGTNAFSGNAPGGDCNSEADILAAYLPTSTDEQAESSAAPLAAYPNPSAVPATLAFALDAPAEATVVVYDALGREVARPHDGPASGAVTARLPALPAGLYVARLTTDDGREESIRLTVLR